MEACGKAILSGEHFAIHGVPAVAVPLPAVRLRLEPGESVPDPRVAEAWATIREALELPSSPLDAPLPFTIRSDLPPGAGVGSSAALAVALIRRAVSEGGRELATAALASLARRVEDRFHQPSSGLDPAVVAWERPLRWQPPAPPRILRWPWPNLDLLVAIATGTRTTAEAVDRVRQFARGNLETFGRMREHAVVLADRWCDAMQEGSEPNGRWMAEAHGMLRDMGLSSPAIEDIVAAAGSAGALGAKISGAGLAGAVAVLVRNAEAPRIARSLLGAGARTVLAGGLAARVPEI